MSFKKKKGNGENSKMKSEMKCKKRISVILVFFAIVFSCTSIPAHAKTITTEDGFEVTISTDKENYVINEEIKVTLTVTNNNASAENVTLSSVLPAGLKLKGDTDKISVDYLKSGETLSLEFTAIATNSAAAYFPKTGDNTPILMILIFVCISFVAALLIFKKKNKFIKFFIFILCFCLAGTVTLKVNAKELKQITLSKTISVEKTEYKISALVTYAGIQSESETEEEKSTETAVVVETESETETGAETETETEEVNDGNKIINPSFETGDLSGWTVIEGTAFSDSSISDADTWWGEKIPYNKDGTYHLDGWCGEGEGAKGILRSSTFTLEGSGFITFRLGGAKDTSSTYILVINATTGETIARYGNTEFADINFPSVENGMRLANMVQYKADLSPYIGEDLYIEIVDNAVSDWGLIFADEFNTYYESEPQEQILANNLYRSYTENPYLYNIYNHNFEIPDLDGWEDNNGAFEQKSDVIEGKEGEVYLKSTIEGTGKLKSQEFTLGGTGKVSVLIGGEGAKEQLYAGIYLSETNELIHQFKITGSEQLTFQEIDLSDYLLQKMYVCVVDNDTDGYILLDNVNLYNRGVIAYWSFDENTGKYAEDSISSIKDFIEYVFNNAVYTKPQDPQWRSNGVKGGSLLFDGFSSYIERESDSIEQPTDALTIEAWVAPRVYEWGDGGKLSAIVSQYNKDSREGYILGMYRHGTWSLQLGIDDSWVEIFCEDHPLEKYQWNYVVATFDKSTSTAKLYLNGELVKEQSTPLNKGITPSSENLIIGKNNFAVNLATVFNYNMFSGLMDEIKIHNTALSDEQVGTQFNEYTGGTLQVPVLAAEDIDIDESVFEGDKDRPQYHAMPSGNWMNESHAPIYYNGKYHLFYQSNPQGPYWHQIHWGHWVSDDMVHWENVRPALAPESGDLDPDGIWSGSAAYDRDKNPVLFYTAGNDSASPNQRVAIATPKDLSDEKLVEWEKNSEPVIIQEQGIGVFGEFRDPFVWYDEDDDMWFALVTSGREDRAQGTALVYTSTDMVNWDYQGHLMDEDVSSYTNLGTVWELPVLLSIGDDSNGNEKYAFFITPCRDDADVEVNYWIGTFDKNTCKFVPDSIEPRCLDLGDGYLTAQCGFKTPDGRTVLYSIVQNVRTPQAEYESGWAHTNALPIEISMGDGDLKISPIEELESLRIDKPADITDKNLNDANNIIKDIQGDMLEIKIEFDNINDAKKFGISVRKSPNSKEKTDLYYDVEKGGFYVDRDKTSLDPDARSYGIQGGEVELNGENVILHIYLDRSIIECFINDSKKLTTRVYPMRYDSLGLELFSDKDINIKSMEVWSLNALDDTVEPVYEAENWDTTVYSGTVPLFNHDFASGDLTGWSSTGNAFTDANVSTQEKFWATIYFNPSRRFPGGYHLWGFNEANGGDAATGTLTSQEFIMGGNGKIDFLVSGGDDIEKLYVALVRSSDGKELFKQTGFDYEEYIRVRWDASDYIGEKLYIKIVDYSQDGFGHINVDDFNLLIQCSDLAVENYSENINTGESFTLTIITEDGINTNDVTQVSNIEVLDETILSIDGQKIIGLKEGTSKVVVTYGNMSKEIEIKVKN